ncbi:DEAD/DEAH box helicase [Bacillus sp. KH172YL63]|uniref:DEAD/DEAH box helicase n=1 Tax=Bacillus sp. KH172YL63 TaxID=2709784 RepID=UPI0013E507C4|nr:helicase SNF [Bacillus sp. KH172YL63]
MKVIHHTFIKERCGTVSFKRGEAYVRSDKVKIIQYTNRFCEAVVSGEEEFHVTVRQNEKGLIESTCTCPKLASFDKDCQHVAAVMLAMWNLQTKVNNGKPTVTDDFLTLFETEQGPAISRQRHFETRQTVTSKWIVKHTPNGKSGMLCIELILNDIPVQDLPSFLSALKQGKECPVSARYTFDRRSHCFEQDSDAIIQYLMRVLNDGKAHNRGKALVIPPSSWEQLATLLSRAEKVIVEHGGRMYDGIQQSSSPLPLLFQFGQGEEGYRLSISGFDGVDILEEYQTALHEGIFTALAPSDCRRLIELERLLATSGKDFIPIPDNQVGLFLEKVAIGLKKLGRVDISKDLSTILETSSLKAKLYLDKVKNRLLAGLEFHYGQIVIHPLENREAPSGSMIIRDVEKEDTILELMEKFSFGKTEGGYFLHHEDLEYEFLTYGVEQVGKFVQIYATTAVRNRVVKGTHPPKIRVKVKKERMNWLEFKFELDGISDGQIQGVLQALEEKRKYYRLRNGSLLSLETKEFQDIQRFLHVAEAEKNDLIKGLALPFYQSLDLLDSGDSFRLDESFNELYSHLMNPDSRDIPVPASLESVLRDYQKTGFRWMKTLSDYRMGGILADDMGLGKTLQSIAFILSEIQDIREGQHPVLIICPSSLTYNWRNELSTFAPDIQAIIMDGSKAERMKKRKEAENVDVIITSYPLLRSDGKWYEGRKFHTVFYDEAQAFKNPVTQTARAVKKIDAVNRFALTGTPLENSLEEIWSIFHVVFPELFRGLKNFSSLTRKDIGKRIKPFLLRRMKEDVLTELPGKQESIEFSDLLPEQKELYAAYLAKLRHDTLKHLNKNTFRKNKIKILAGLTRLRQICCHPALFVDGYQQTSAKFIQLMELVEEAKRSGRRVLIFSQFTKMLEMIGRELSGKGHPYFYLNGSTPSEERVKMCDEFNMGRKDFFLISLKAGGTGLNLTSADTVILYDTWWNPAVEEQAADRAHRMGQRNTVQVIKLISKGTIEEKMNELQDKKRNLIQDVMNPDETLVQTLTEEELKEILLVK